MADKSYKHYVYDPFPGNCDGTVRNDAKLYESKYGDAKKNSNGESNPKVLIASNVNTSHEYIKKSLGVFAEKPLKVVKDEDVLLINAHGSAGRDVVGAKFEEIGKFGGKTGNKVDLLLTAKELAKHIEMDGLGKGHVKVRLLSCYGAGADQETGTEFKATDHFAKLLAIELGLLGYRQIRVSGYQGSITCATTGKVYSESHTAVHGTKLTYDSQGNRVASTRPQYTGLPEL